MIWIVIFVSHFEVFVWLCLVICVIFFLCRNFGSSCHYLFLVSFFPPSTLWYRGFHLLSSFLVMVASPSIQREMAPSIQREMVTMFVFEILKVVWFSLWSLFSILLCHLLDLGYQDLLLFSFGRLNIVSLFRLLCSIDVLNLSIHRTFWLTCR